MRGREVLSSCPSSFLEDTREIEEPPNPHRRTEVCMMRSIHYCCCLHIKKYPGLSIQHHLLLSQLPRTNPTLDAANFRGHRLTSDENHWDASVTCLGCTLLVERTQNNGKEGDGGIHKPNQHKKTTDPSRTGASKPTRYSLSKA